MKRLPPWAILAAAWIILVVYAYPGQLTQDSFDHLREARSGIYSDAHPAIIDLIWKVLDTIISGPILMLLLQSGLLLAGLYYIFRIALEPKPAAWWTFGVFVFPPVLCVMAVIWKDCQMAGFLAIGIAGLLSPKRSRRVLGLVAITVATALRYNAFGATLPLVVLLFEWRPGMHWLRRYALATAVWFATAFAALGVDAALTDKPMHYWHSSLAIYDIIGTYAHLDEDLPDAQLLADLEGTQLKITKDIHQKIREVYTPRDFFPILNDPKLTFWDLPINGYEPAPQAQRDAIERAWWHVVTTYPWAFIEHRFAVFAECLDITSTHSMGAITRREFRYPDYAAQQGVLTIPSAVQIKLTRWLQWLSRHTPLFTPWLYFVLSLILIPVAWRQRAVLALVLSGIFMELTLLPLVHSRDYRYSHWMVITTTIAIIILTTQRARRARQAP